MKGLTISGIRQALERTVEIATALAVMLALMLVNANAAQAGHEHEPFDGNIPAGAVCDPTIVGGDGHVSGDYDFGIFREFEGSTYATWIIVYTHGEDIFVDPDQYEAGKSGWDRMTKCKLPPPSTTTTELPTTTTEPPPATTEPPPATTEPTTATTEPTTATTEPPTTTSSIPAEVLPTSIVPSTTAAATGETLPFTGVENGTYGLIAMALIGVGALALVGAKTLASERDEQSEHG